MEALAEFIKSLLNDNIYTLCFAGLSMLVAIANFITMAFPSVKDNKVYNFIMKVLNFLALNIFKNKNKDDVKQY